MPLKFFTIFHKFRDNHSGNIMFSNTYENFSNMRQPINENLIESMVISIFLKFMMVKFSNTFALFWVSEVNTSY